MNKEDLEKLNEETHKILRQVAEKGGVIFFDYLAERLSRKLEVHPAEIKRNLGPTLSSLSKEEYKRQGIMISVLVVDNEGYPWPSFFILAQNLGAMGQRESEEGFFRNELRRVRRAYRISILQRLMRLIGK